MGVDLGSKRIGLALSDPTRVVASPHEVLQRGRDHGTDHAAIVNAAREAGADHDRRRIALSLSGAIGPAAKATLAEVEELRAVAEPVGIAVVAYDERSPRSPRSAHSTRRGCAARPAAHRRQGRRRRDAANPGVDGAQT
jgi:putative Holliday junction resolvase